MDLTGISIDLSDYMELAVFLVIALLSYWGIMKGIDLIDSSRESKKASAYFDYWDSIGTKYDPTGRYKL